MCSSGFKRISSLFLFAFLWTLLTDGVDSQCVMKLNMANPPLLMKKLGSKSIILPQSPVRVINLDEYDQLEVYCGSGFTKFRVYDRSYGQQEYDSLNRKSLNFQCKSRALLIANLETIKEIRDTTIGCREGVYTIFETKENLTNCERYESYAMGAKYNPPIILAAFCYDLENTNLKYVSFKLASLSPILDKAKNSYPVGLNEQSLMEPLSHIENIFQFPSNQFVSAVIEKDALTNYWLRIANYELASIVQLSSYGHENFESFSSYFHIIWWRNLRKGNWQQFVELLERRAKRVLFNIFLGTSGTVRVPLANECLGETALEIGVNDKQKAVPQFIWAYMQPATESVIDEFVVIAYNSPYYENFPKNNTVLCRDMCQEIDWLKPMEISRSISTFGVMYCCRAEEVVGLLDGFPLNNPSGARTISYSTVNPKGSVSP